MRIAVMGPGGVGGYFGARLAQAGHDVTFIARGKHLEAIQEKGLALKSPRGDAVLKVRAVGAAAEAGPADIVLFAVKLWDTEPAAQQLRPVVEKGGHVIAFQNGVESVARIGAVLGKERVMGGAAYIAARIAEPGTIVQTGTVARLRFGPALPSQRTAAEAFHAACTGAKIDCELADDLVAKTLAQAETFAPEMRASMAADLEAGGKLEAAWLSGAVARMSAEAGLEARVNRAVYAALKPFVNGSAGKAS